MLDDTRNWPDALAHRTDLHDIDVSKLPVWQGDPLASFYRPMVMGEWELTTQQFGVALGYFGGIYGVWNMPILKRGDQVWMSLCPVELESQWIGIDNARGHVAIFGLGLGWSAAMTALHPEVEKVTVVDRDADVIELNKQLGVFDRLPDGMGGKIEIVEGDALEWKPDRHVDLLMPDIWLNMVSNGRERETLRMQRNVEADFVYFWGQELELARHIVRDGGEIDDRSIAEMAARFELPLIGLDTPDYAENTKKAARRWMNGRWFEGTDLPADLRIEADILEGVD